MNPFLSMTLPFNTSFHNNSQGGMSYKHNKISLTVSPEIWILQVLHLSWDQGAFTSTSWEKLEGVVYELDKLRAEFPQGPKAPVAGTISTSIYWSPNLVIMEHLSKIVTCEVFILERILGFKGVFLMFEFISVTPKTSLLFIQVIHWELCMPLLNILTLQYWGQRLSYQGIFNLKVVQFP